MRRFFSSITILACFVIHGCGKTQEPGASVSPSSPRVWSAETKRVKVATPEGEESRDIVYHTNTIGIRLVLLPAGEFMMGSRDSAEQVLRKANLKNGKAEWFADEHPQYRVAITKPFYMGAYEVTQAEYERVMGTNPSEFKGQENPVGNVSWDDAIEFCKRLSAKDGHAYRLPTEAEWEYACRGGTTTPFYVGETISTEQANYYNSTALRPKRVGSFPPNRFGLYDMHGNVCEWCQDWYDEAYYAQGLRDDPTGPATGRCRVRRGGSWIDLRYSLRSADRFKAPPWFRDLFAGFRVVLPEE